MQIYSRTWKYVTFPGSQAKSWIINLSFWEIVSICMSCVQEVWHSPHRCGNTRQDDSYNDTPCGISTHVLWSIIHITVWHALRLVHNEYSILHEICTHVCVASFRGVISWVSSVFGWISCPFCFSDTIVAVVWLSRANQIAMNDMGKTALFHTTAKRNEVEMVLLILGKYFVLQQTLQNRSVLLIKHYNSFVIFVKFLKELQNI